MSQFNELLSELQTLAKAQPAEGDDKIVAAAAEGGGQGSSDEEGDEAGEAAAGEETMGKSMQVTLANGEVVDAVDGTQLVKAMQDRLDANEATLTKALEMTVGLLKSQGAQIADLSAKLKAVSSEGKGRKATLAIMEKAPVGGADLTKSQPNGIGAEEFMVKALDAQRSGRLTGLEVSLAEANLNRGQPVPANIIAKVMQPQG